MSIPGSVLRDDGSTCDNIQQAIAVTITGGATTTDPAAVLDVEFACASTDGRKIVLQLLGDGSTNLTELDGSPIADGATAVNCDDKDIETVKTCFQDITDNTIKFSRVTLVDTSTTPATVQETLWLDAAGAIVAAPTNVEECDVDVAFVEKYTGKLCYTAPDTQIFDTANGTLNSPASYTDGVLSIDGSGHATGLVSVAGIGNLGYFGAAAPNNVIVVTVPGATSITVEFFDIDAGETHTFVEPITNVTGALVQAGQTVNGSGANNGLGQVTVAGDTMTFSTHVGTGGGVGITQVIVGGGGVREAYGYEQEDGSIIYKDAVTGLEVTIDDTNLTTCPVEVTGGVAVTTPISLTTETITELATAIEALDDETELLDDYCYDIPAVTTSEALSGLTGTLADGTTYTISTGAGFSVAPTVDANGDLSTTGNGDPDTPTVNIAFSAPVTFTLNPVVGASISSVWQDVGGFQPNEVRSNGDLPVYTPGAGFTIPFNTTANGLTLAGVGTTGTPDNSDWGQIVFANTTSVDIDIVAVEKFNLQVSNTTPAVSGKAYKVFDDDDNSFIALKDRDTHAVITTNEAELENLLVECPEETTTGTETGGSQTLTNGQTFSFPANAKSISIAPNDTSSSYDFVGGAYNTLGSNIAMNIGQGNSEVITNSDAGVVTATGTIHVAWEV